MNHIHHNLAVPVLVSVASVAQAPVLAESSPRSTVDQFYRWYLSHQDRGRQLISQQKEAFDSKLYQQLVKAFKKQPKDGKWLDFDPFLNSQMGGKSYSIKGIQVNQSTAKVTVLIVGSRGGAGRPITVALQKQQQRWRINNFLYPEGFDLLSHLQNINKPPQR